jgi:hypothetical protein
VTISEPARQMSPCRRPVSPYRYPMRRYFSHQPARPPPPPLPPAPPPPPACAAPRTRARAPPLRAAPARRAPPPARRLSPGVRAGPPPRAPGPRICSLQRLSLLSVVMGFHFCASASLASIAFLRFQTAFSTGLPRGPPSGTRPFSTRSTSQLGRERTRSQTSPSLSLSPRRSRSLRRRVKSPCRRTKRRESWNSGSDAFNFNRARPGCQLEACGEMEHSERKIKPPSPCWICLPL